MLSLAMCWTSKVPLFPPFFPHPYHLKNLHPMAEAHSWTMWRAMAQGRNWEILWKWRPLQRSWARWGVGHGGHCGHGFSCDSRAERSVGPSTSGRPHLAGLCEGEHGPLEHCCRRITGCWHFFKNLSKRQVEVVQPCIVPLKAQLELVIVSGVPGLMKSETESDLDIGYIG